MLAGAVAGDKHSPPFPEALGAPGVAGTPGLESTLCLHAEVGEVLEEGDPELLALHHAEEGQPEAPKQKKRWMGFDEFCVCFR